MQLRSAILAAALLVATGCGTTANQHRPSVEPSALAKPGSVIDFGKGVEVRKRADGEKLIGTPDAFKSFIGHLATHPQDSRGCDIDMGTRVITVRKYDSTGFAIGDSFDNCAGYVAFWGKRNGRWAELIGTQTAVSCTRLHKLRIPPSMENTCVGSKSTGYKQEHYRG